MKTRSWKAIIAASLCCTILFSCASGHTVIESVKNVDEPEAAATEPANTEVPVDIEPVELATYTQTEEYNFDSIVADAEQEQAYRDSVKYVENTIVFSVIKYRKTGEKASYLKDSDDLCKNYSLTNVSFVLELKVKDVEQKSGYDSYQMFYTADVKTDDIWALVDQMRADKEIYTAEPDFIWEKTDENDMTVVSGEALASEVEAAGWVFDDLDCVNVWNNLTPGHAPGEGVVVAVIDTGVDYNHIDLKRNMWTNPGEIPDNGIDDDHNGYVDDVHGINLIDPAKQGDPMDDMGHGTHVAGIIAMTPGNGGGVGIAYGSKIMAIKAGQASGYFASTDIAKAIQYADANGADVINMSFGGTGKSSLVEAALADAFGSCVLVASAGNDGATTTDAPLTPREDIYPAGYSYVLGVMACDNNGNKASFSNWDYYKYANCEYEMIAPGVSIFSCLPGNRYARWSGTSMAAPAVSAAAAIIRRENPDKSKYSSRYIMGQLASATQDVVNYVDPNGVLHVYSKLNVRDSLNLAPKPNVQISDIHFFDTKAISETNNNDGVVQAGETIDLGFVVSNYWGIAKDVVVHVDALSIADIPNPYVEFITDEITFDDEVGTFAAINNGFVYDNDMLVGVDNPIRLKIKDDAPNDLLVTINFTVTAKNAMDDNDQTIYGVYGDYKYSYTFNVQRGTYLRGTITEDMTLTADKLWIVDRSVLIPEGVTVNVDPGTKIQFHSEEEGPYAELHMTNITVKGLLNINGSFENPVEIFPSKGMEDYSVDIYVTENCGIINMDYTYILNPCIVATNGNHLSLIQNTIGSIKRIVDGQVVLLSSTNQLIHFDSLKNSKVLNLNNGYIHAGSTFYPTVISNVDTVLFDNNVFNFNSHLGLDCGRYFSFGDKISVDMYQRSSVNSVFLNNSREIFASTIFAGNSETYETSFSFNAILNNYYHPDTWTRVRIKLGSSNSQKWFDIKSNYWGTSNEEMIERIVVDQYDDATLPRADYSNYLTLDDDMSSIYPFVTEAYVTDMDGNRLSEVANSQTVQIHVKFNRDMAQDSKYEPMVSFGPAEPYTDYVVQGDWSSAREWVGEINIDPFINQGTEYLRIKDAAAADDLWLTTGTDKARFAFNITKTSAEALTLQGSGGSNQNYLNWVQDDYDTLAGYNLYRGTSYNSGTEPESQGFTKINDTIISNDTYEFIDTDVEQGQDYYYYFTVVDTDFNESPASNVVKCTPLDIESPVITTNAIETRTVGQPITINATVTDNVEVTGVELFYKMQNSESWQQSVMRNTVDDTYQAVIPVYAIEEGTLEYYIVAHDGTNDTYCGDAELPNVISVVGVIDVEVVSLDKTSVSMHIGDTESLTATIYPEDATYQEVIWSSSDESVATVKDGIITAVGVGTATITASAADGAIASICRVSVDPIPVTDLTITPESKELLVGGTFTISAVTTPDNATDGSVRYESGDIGVATVDNTGKVTAVGVGETDIAVSANDESGISKVCHVVVSPVAVQAVMLDCVSKNVEVGESFALTPTIYPVTATDKTVIWATSDADVVTVVDGVATARGVGSATITVTTNSGNKQAICNVTVTGGEIQPTPDPEPDPSTPARVKSCSLALNDMIGVRFKLTLPKEFLEDSGAYAIVNGTKCELTKDGSVYIAQYNVSATQMRDKLLLRLYRGDGSLYPLLNKAGEDVTSTGFEYSVATYIDDANASGRADEDLLTLLNRMSDFGKLAQVYFDYHPSEGSYSPIISDVDNVTLDNLSRYVPVFTQADNAGIQRTGTSLELKTATLIHHKFQLDSGKKISDYLFYVDAKRIKTSSSGDVTLKYNRSTGKYVLSIENIKSTELQTPHEVVVKDKNGTEVLKISNYSALSYVHTVISQVGNNSSYTNLVRLLKGLYLYNRAALVHFKVEEPFETVDILEATDPVSDPAPAAAAGNEDATPAEEQSGVSGEVDEGTDAEETDPSEDPGADATDAPVKEEEKTDDENGE